jgi:hypothetical protein
MTRTTLRFQRCRFVTNPAVELGDKGKDPQGLTYGGGRGNGAFSGLSHVH